MFAVKGRNPVIPCPLNPIHAAMVERVQDFRGRGTAREEVSRAEGQLNTFRVERVKNRFEGAKISADGA